MIALTLSLTLIWTLQAPPAAEPGKPFGAQPGAAELATELVLEQHETIEQLALRVLGDEKAAVELRAYNQLPGGAVAAGTRLKIPGQERTLAAKALSAAVRAVATTENDPEKKTRGEARLADAERLFAEARYDEAAKAADEAWALVSAEGKTVRFRVEVAKDGETEVASTSGAAVRVEAQGVSRTVQAGQSVKVKKGEPPPTAEVLAVPTPVKPVSGAILRSKRKEGSLTPVTLSWTSVAAAESYELEVVSMKGGEPLSLIVGRASTRLPALEPGRYTWTVRAVRGTERSEPSPVRAFEMVEEVLKLEVKGSSWK